MQRHEGVEDNKNGKIMEGKCREMKSMNFTAEGGKNRKNGDVSCSVKLCVSIKMLPYYYYFYYYNASTLMKMDNLQNLLCPVYFVCLAQMNICITMYNVCLYVYLYFLSSSSFQLTFSTQQE